WSVQVAPTQGLAGGGKDQRVGGDGVHLYGNFPADEVQGIAACPMYLGDAPKGVGILRSRAPEGLSDLAPFDEAPSVRCARPLAAMGPQVVRPRVKGIGDAVKGL